MVNDKQIVLAAEIVRDQNDVHQLHPMLDKAQANLAAAGIQAPISTLVADAGYYSEENITMSTGDTPELLIATTKDHKQRKEPREQGPPRGRIPKGLSPKELMERKLRTQRGRRLYDKRCQTVEPVFGQHELRGGKSLCRRGVGACDWASPGKTDTLKWGQ
ncbi:hypothetical protein BH23ACT11_BH23ACT11_26620 [soil metagenome]